VRVVGLPPPACLVMPTPAYPFSVPDDEPAEPGVAAKRFAALAEVLIRTASHTGANALEQLTRTLGATLNAKRAHISRCCPEAPSLMRFMAQWGSSDTAGAGGTFPIKGSASEQTLAEGERHYWGDLEARFPHSAEMYRSWGVCSYLGAPLIDSHGRTIGVIAVLFGEGNHDRVLAVTILRLFAIRASAELDRLLAEERRAKIENALRAAARGTADVVGEAFFGALVLELGRALGARAVYLSRIRPEDVDHVLRIAGMEEGRLLPRVPVELARESPTRETLAAGYLHVPAGARARYPSNPVLARLEADAFIGVALRSARGEILGALTLLGVDAVQDAELARSMLLVFAARAAAEIERGEADAAVARIERQLRQTQKMEAIGTLAGGIAHDFNNILTGILGNTQLAQLSAPADSPDVNRHLELVIQGCLRARDLIARILAFTHNHEQPMRCCALGALVRETMDLLKPGLASSITLRARLPSDEMHIFADPGQIHQILLNLCTNAVHALTPGGGVIELSVDTIPAHDEWRSRHVQVLPEHDVRVTVADDGPGIPVELHERIFEPFFTTKPPGQGSGLGLAGVHGLIRAHSGAIVLEAEPGKGAKFHLCFQRCAPPAPPASPAGAVFARAETKGAPRRLRLMIVDDEPTITNVALGGLGRFGWDVSAFNDPHDALAAFLRAPEGFDAVVSDLSMPGMDGAALAAELFARRPGLPLVMISGYMRGRGIESARRAGVTRFLNKPFDLNALDEILRAACREII
jgi:signal transduction histidine kinase/ActR/RegA family two-component response regulator